MKTKRKPKCSRLISFKCQMLNFKVYNQTVTFKWNIILWYLPKCIREWNTSNLALKAVAIFSLSKLPNGKLFFLLVLQFWPLEFSVKTCNFWRWRNLSPFISVFFLGRWKYKQKERKTHTFFHIIKKIPILLWRRRLVTLR